MDPKNTVIETIHVRVERPLLERLEMLAAIQDRSLSATVRCILRAAAASAQRNARPIPSGMLRPRRASARKRENADD
jgi:hypothetical protein